MKFTVETNVLNEALKKAGATLSQKDNTPLFRNFALKAKDDKLTIMSTDTDLATICVVPVTNVEEGEVTIPGAKFQNIAKLTDSPNITVESEGTSIKVYSETTNYVLQGLDASEFPELAVITNQDTKKADRAQFLENLNRISFSISDNEARKNLLAVFIAKGYIQASDGHVSSVCKFDSQLDNLLIPSSAVTELVKVLLLTPLRLLLMETSCCSSSTTTCSAAAYHRLSSLTSSASSLSRLRRTTSILRSIRVSSNVQ